MDLYSCDSSRIFIQLLMAHKGEVRSRWKFNKVRPLDLRDNIKEKLHS